MSAAVDTYVRAFISSKAEIDADEISSFRFEASEAHDYSEFTSDDFSCFVKYTTRSQPDEERVLFWDEGDVVAFLNGFPREVAA